MQAFLTAVFLTVAFALQAQTGPVRPEFAAYQIGPTGGRLWPGRMFTIYGKNLGPAQSCVRDPGPFRSNGPNTPDEMAAIERALPVELCGVQVLIDEEPVPLIYVHEKQINFVVPGSRAFGDKVMLRVVHTGVSGIPVAVKFGADRMWLYQDQPAYTGMPVWVRLYNVSDGKTPVQLPFGIPLFWLTECPHLEVKLNDVLMPLLQPKTPPRQISYSGPGCPTPPVPDRQSLAGRIALHLWYRMDRPGMYHVRYVPGSGPMTAPTEWTFFEVKAGSAEQRRKWLLEKRQSAPTDREGLLYNFLPSIFGYGDPDALQIGLRYLYNPDASVSAAAAGYLRSYYPAAQLIPALQALELQRGKNRTVAGLLAELPGKP